MSDALLTSSGMSPALKGASPNGPSMRDVVIRSVGSASARSASALASDLGISLEAAAVSIFRAPTTVATGLSAEASEELVSLLQRLGLVAAAVPAGQSALPAKLLDVAAVITDAARVDEAAEVLSEVLGVAPAQATELMTIPPGVILGGVSRATVDALQERLPAGVIRLLFAEPSSSRYALFAAGLSKGERIALEGELGAALATAGEGLIAFDLSRVQADALWRRFARHGGVRIVHESFLLYDIEWNGVDPGCANAAETLERLANVPAFDYQALLPLLPVTIEEDVSHADIAPRLHRYAESGFQVTARLSSFDERVLEVVSAPAAARALIGLNGTVRLPLRLPPLNVSRARVLRARLEAAGADVILVHRDVGGTP